MANSVQVFTIVLLACVVLAQAWERRDVSHLEEVHGGHGGGYSHGEDAHGKATSYQSNVLHSFHPVPVYVKESHGGHGDGGYEGHH